jgi:hypothetical protein
VAAERLLAEHEGMLSQARQEMSAGTFGAGDWVAHNQKMVDGLRKILAIHVDWQLIDGTVVRRDPGLADCFFP